MVPAIVPVYAAVLALIYIVLSARVIQARRSAKVAIGTRGNVHLERKIGSMRTSPNMSPSPCCSSLSLRCKAGRRGLYICFASHLWGHASHAYGVSQEHENFRLRMAGMATTFTLLSVMALLLFARAAELSWP